MKPCQIAEFLYYLPFLQNNRSITPSTGNFSRQYRGVLTFLFFFLIPVCFHHGPISNSKDAKHFVQTCVPAAARTVAVKPCVVERKIKRQTAKCEIVNKQQTRSKQQCLESVQQEWHKPTCVSRRDSGGCRCHLPERPLHFFARPNLLHHHVTQHTCNKANVSLNQKAEKKKS